jgi:hypothetical protein
MTINKILIVARKCVTTIVLANLVLGTISLVPLIKFVPVEKNNILK